MEIVTIFLMSFVPAFIVFLALAYSLKRFGGPIFISFDKEFFNYARGIFQTESWIVSRDSLTSETDSWRELFTESKAAKTIINGVEITFCLKLYADKMRTRRMVIQFNDDHFPDGLLIKKLGEEISTEGLMDNRQNIIEKEGLLKILKGSESFEQLKTSHGLTELSFLFNCLFVASEAKDLRAVVIACSKVFSPKAYQGLRA